MNDSGQIVYRLPTDMSPKSAKAKKRATVTDDGSAIRAESRSRVAALARNGQSHIALAENLKPLGIEVKSGKRPQLVSVRGVRIRG